jgi:hypothetical protein
LRRADELTGRLDQVLAMGRGRADGRAQPGWGRQFRRPVLRALLARPEPPEPPGWLGAGSGCGGIGIADLGRELWHCDPRDPAW